MSAAAGRKTFEETLAFGEQAEERVAWWLRKRGYCLVPIYKRQDNQKKGPRFLLHVDSSGQNKKLIVPDFLSFAVGQPSPEFIEVKHKTNFAWNRRCETWVTGFDLYLYQDYIEIASITGLQVSVLFLHSIATPSLNDKRHGCPDVCPTGLYAERLAQLSSNVLESGLSGGREMLYWDVRDLRHVADTKELELP